MTMMPSSVKLTRHSGQKGQKSMSHGPSEFSYQRLFIRAYNMESAAEMLTMGFNSVTVEFT